MACVTVKRSLDHETSTVPSSKRRRFHCGSRSPTQLTTSSSASVASSSAMTFVPPPPAPAASEVSSASEFPASRLPPEQLSQRLTAEVRRLQRRRLVPTTATSSSSPPSSPSSSSAARGVGNSSDSEMPALAAGGTTATATCAQCAAKSGEPPLLTLSQVQSIAEKLLAEREQQVRAEFQALLSAKLQEQYDAFLRFNHDQIYRMHSGAPMSYVS